MNEQRHIIKKEVLELTVSDRAHALPIQNKASEVVKYKLNPALDALFSKISKADEIVRIDKLVIDLGTIQGDKLDDEFLRQVITKTEDQITELIHSQKPDSQKAEQFPAKKEDDVPVKVISPHQNYLEQFISFLKTGHLPWWKSSGLKNPLEEILNHILNLDEKILQDQLLPLFKFRQIRERLVNQFNEQDIEKLLKRIDAVALKQFSVLYLSVQPIASLESVNERQLKRSFWEKVIEWISENKAVKTDPQIISFIKEILFSYFDSETKEAQESNLLEILNSVAQEAKKGLSKKSGLIIAALLSTAKVLQLNPEKFTVLIKLSGLENQQIVATYIEVIKKGEVKEQTEKGTGGKQEMENVAEAAAKTETKEQKKESIPDSKDDNQLIMPTRQARDSEKKETELIKLYHPFSTTDEIFISNAGLVILHPFLKYFFDGLGLLNKEQQFNSQEDTFKAVHLLQYMVTGKQENPEYELALNKILCGIDLEEPVPLEVILTLKETDECNNLLISVLDQWKVLKTKKTEAITETFLEREGILSYGNQGWNLKVERNTFDVMLDKLPWGISIIKLPWNPQILYVEW